MDGEEGEGQNLTNIMVQHVYRNHHRWNEMVVAIYPNTYEYLSGKIKHQTAPALPLDPTSERSVITISRHPVLTGLNTMATMAAWMVM